MRHDECKAEEIPQDDILAFYVREVERVIEEGTVGDYTWIGILRSFYDDMLGGKISVSL